MFKNKTKTDSRIRWQNQGFKNSLNSQRSYKRTARKVPEKPLAVFLSKIGLESLLTQVITALVFLLVIYIVFIPNFIFVKNISINNGEEVPSSVTNFLDSYLKKYTPWPQKNLLFLSKAGLKNFLLEKDRNILSVDNVKKDFPSGLLLNLTLRKDTYAVETASSTYFSLAQDGFVTAEIYKNASGTLPSNLMLIKLNQGQSLQLSQKPFKENEFGFITKALVEVPISLKSPLQEAKVSDFQNPYFEIVTQNGITTKLDASSNFEETIKRFNLLIAQLQPGDVKALEYVDMRFADRAYVCYKGAVCENDTFVIPTPSPTPSTTTTPTSIK